MKNLYHLPENLPVPVVGGACDHLERMLLPSLSLKTSPDSSLDLAAAKGIVVIFFYPMIGRPNSPPMVGWNEIPGARGCTPQACAYRDSYIQLTELGAKVYGASSQAIEEQNEAVTRLKLPFGLINDSAFELSEALNLPTFNYQGG